MTQKPFLGSHLNKLVKGLLSNYRKDERTQFVNKRHLPSRSEIVDIVGLILEVVYPGLYGRQQLNDENLEAHVEETLLALGRKLHAQIVHCICYEEGHPPNENTEHCDEQARDLVLGFFRQMPQVRDMLGEDVQAAYDGDPAAKTPDEVILSYPGLFAITVYRCAHELFIMDVPLMPRIMTEHAHSITGIDIHPGATIGHAFFIDHGTGVVIGETTQIGNNVKVYQGVTLGALSFPKDERGRVIKGYKRHPTIEDNVVIYANATVLGGETVIGENSQVNGGIFITSSIPPNCTVGVKHTELQVKERRKRTKSSPGAPPRSDFQI